MTSRPWTLLCLATVVFTMVTLAGSACAQGADATWERVVGPLDPPPAIGHQLVRDPLRHRVLLLNGGTLDAVWSMSLPAAGAIDWQRIPIAGPHPDYRFQFSAAYDPPRDRILLFGGVHYDLTTFVASVENDVWALSLTGSPAWTQITADGEPPPPRGNGTFTYDPVRDRMIVFGGLTDGYNADTWSLDLAGTPTWRKLSPVGNRQPSGREGAAAVYDPWNDRLLMFGGWGTDIHDDLWSLSLAGETRWDTLPVSPRPPARHNCTAVVDPIHAELVITNGDGWQGSSRELSDAWALNLPGIRSWRELTVSGDVPTIGDQSGIYSPERNSIIEYGGDSNLSLCRELSLDDGRWRSLLPPQPDPMPVRRGESMLIADPASDRLLVFGGVGWGCQPDLWSLSLTDAPGWEQLPTEGPPAACTADQLVFDPVRRRLLAFPAPAPATVYTSMDQVWAMPLDEPRVWTKLSPAGPLPPGRSGFSLIYDPRRDRVLLFGGTILNGRSDDSGQSQEDLWELSLGDSLRWRQLTPVGSPGSRYEHQAVYDYARDRMIVFQGEQSQPCEYYCFWELDDAWALSLAGDSLRWNRLGPNAPVRGSLVLDPGRDRLLVWPGDNSAWELSLADTTAWRPLTIDGGLPTARQLSGFVFDPTRDRFFVMGGLQTPFGSGFGLFGSFTSDVFALRFAGDSGTQVAVRESRVTPAKVELLWGGLTSSQPASVLRADGDGPFVTKASLTANAGGEVGFSDAAVVPGRHYHYALSLDGGVRRLGETAVDVPFAPAFALGGAYPNPAVRDLSLAFSLLDASPARVDVFDLAGRRVAGRDVGAMGAGRHLLPMGRFAPGVYIVRLSQGPHNATIRAAVVR